MSGIDGVRVDASVWALQPGYEAVLVEAVGLTPGPSDATSDALLSDAEATAASRIAGRELPDVPELAAWREAYRSFGAKPQRTRPSVEALLRRLGDGLPRVDRLTDAYNAVSVAHLLPVGGEDLDAYVGSPALVRAVGDERFETTAGGEAVTETVDAGEVIWRDDLGVTCRRWNWRQCTRTRLTTATTHALFILDWLPTSSPAQSSPQVVAAALTEALAAVSPGATLSTRHLTRGAA